MKASIQKWGNSLAVRIPKSVAQEAKLTNGSEVDLRLEGNRVVLVPAAKQRPTLKQLLKGITPENRHPETDWGPPVGKEIW
ncbi:MAG TPA: AbrB/MazE/SpoVT family DNA-binding domain-containing protein [Opitutaceae bacterium]|jgi:antitoxin MazE|nr:AbrB/MazE/SpoVT family DNA-binding domain-containing protein [Opitutaceae bacterium]